MELKKKKKVSFVNRPQRKTFSGKLVKINIYIINERVFHYCIIFESPNRVYRAVLTNISELYFNLFGVIL